MKIIILAVFLLFIVSIIFIPFTVSAGGICDTSGGGLVPCGQSDKQGNISCPCQIEHVFVLLAKIYNFIVLKIATPLAIIALSLGGILMMISAGKPELMSKGKTIFWSAIIGLALVFCAYTIINSVLSIIGYTGAWTSPF